MPTSVTLFHLNNMKEAAEKSSTKVKSSLDQKVYSIKFLIILMVMPFLFFPEDLLGQIDYDIWERNYLTKGVMSPPPTPSQLGKYVEIPVNLYTGIPNIDIPLYEIDVHGYKLPISLSYHASGIKVQERSSWVGLGWSLNAGGVITRVVRGTPDDQDSVISDCGNNSGKLFSNGRFWSKQFSDIESDMYYFNFNGHTGKFFFDESNKAVISGESKLYKISYDSANISGYGIPEFKIVTDDGTQYIFQDIEVIIDIPTEPDSWEEPAYQAVFFGTSWSTPAPTPLNHMVEDFERKWFRSISSWYLSKIILPNTTEEINFNYTRYKYNYVEKTGEFKKFGYGLYLSNCDLMGSNVDPSIYYSFKASLIDGVYLSNINWNSGSLSFIPSDSVREDTYHGDEIWLNPYCENYDEYQDFYGSEKYLDKIILYDTNDELLKEFDLKHSYFRSPKEGSVPSYKDFLYNRLRLNSVQVISSLGTNMPPYSFSYSEDSLPHRYDPQVDFWGYYNKNGAQNLIPKIWFYPDIADSVNNTIFRSVYCPIPISGYGSATIIDGADRSSNKDVNQACMLKKITYPTGGYDEFTFESNQFILGDTLIEGGGLRIKELKTMKSPGQTAKIKKFYYELSDSCSGRIVNFPLYVSLNQHYDYFDEDGRVDPFNIHHHAYSQCDLGSTQGSIVGYKYVKVGSVSNGREEYWFDFPGTLEEKQAVYDIVSGRYIFERQEKKIQPNFYDGTWYNNWYKDGYPFYPEPDFDWARGQLLKKEVSDENGNLLKRIENNYSYEYETKKMKWKGSKVYWSYSGINPTVCIYSIPLWGEFTMLSGKKYLRESVEKTYNPEDNSKYVLEKTNYDYNDRQLLSQKRKLRSISNSDSLITIYRYSSDETAEPYSSMTELNMLNYPIKTETYMGDTFLESKTTAYKNWYTDLFAPQYIKQKIGNNTEDKIVEFHSFDARMNLLSASKANDITNSYIYGYDSTYPIAKVKNASYNEIHHTSFEDKSGWMDWGTSYDETNKHTGNCSRKITKAQSGLIYSFLEPSQWLDFRNIGAGTYMFSCWVFTDNPRAQFYIFKKTDLDKENFYSSFTADYVRTTTTGKWIYLEKEIEVAANVNYIYFRLDNDLGTGSVWFDDIRFYPSASQMTTYTYDPLIGMTSQTDPNGITTYYEYDGFGRLVKVRDNDRNLMQEYDYHYQGQSLP